MILNEEKYAKDVLTGQRDDVKSIRQKIDLIARYNHHVLHKNSDDSYSSIIKWLEKHHDIFSEQGYSNIISDCIKKAVKRPFYYIDSVKITKKEMDIITAQNNLRYEKILFVLLCMAKVQKASYGFDNGLISYNITDLFKTARVSVPVDERENILHQFLKLDLIGLPMKNDTKCLFVKFVDEYEDDIVLELNEQDCGELAYAYLKYTGKSKVFRCAKCGKLIKQSKKFGDLCKGCQEFTTNMKIKWCIDCGKEFQIDSRNMTKCRCEQCQHVVDKEKTRQRVQKYRENNKL
jgi:DNA-directed RNA polymerase subunit RPC12/RpoP